MEYAVITVKNLNKKIAVRKGTDLLTALVKGNILIPSSCGGKGVCGRCKVKILKGDVESEPTGKISEKEKKEGIYLACRTIVKDNVEIEVFQTATVEKKDQEFFVKGEEFHLIERDLKGKLPFSPIIKKVFLKITPPSLDDMTSDFDRVCRHLKDKMKENKMECVVDLPNLRKLPHLLRDSKWEITLTVFEKEKEKEIIAFEPGDNSKRNYGIAVDVGTTTIAASLVDLNSGEVLKTEITFNKQGTFGEDIITRIVHSEKKGGLEELHHLVSDTINELISNLCEKTFINLNDINCVVCSGNTTMIHLLLKVSPSYLRREPYISVANSFPPVKAAETGIRINPGGMLETIDSGYAYVGGDITSGIMVSGIYEKETVSLFVDVGTNGEIVLGNKDYLVCCSASAGPAFEGSGVKDGMRAVSGAIYKFKIENDKVEYQTINNEKPLGICGSGYIEIIYELFRNGIVDRSGVFNKDRKGVREGEYGPEFLIAAGEDTGTGKDIVITQVDIENLLRAKAAIFSAMHILVKSTGLEFEDIENIFVAGGFGSYLNIEKSIGIGLLPCVEREKIEFIGNSSLLGAIYFLMSKNARRIAKEIVSKLTYIDLSRNNEYMEEYLKALFIPHTETQLFKCLKDD